MKEFTKELSAGSWFGKTYLKHFKEEEFKRATPACSLSDMDLNFMLGIDEARELAQVPFIVLSAYRSEEHELSRGRSGKSSHTKGLALDIKCLDSVTRLKILNALFELKFPRIGIYKTFIHVDSDLSKPKCVWLDSSDSALFKDEF